MKQPLIRLKVEHTGFPRIHVRRFGQMFAGEKPEDWPVANPYDLVQFWRKQTRTNNARSKPSAEEGAEGDSKGEILEAPEISTLVEEELRKGTQKGGLEVLFQNDIFDAVEQFVDKGVTKAIEKMLGDSLETVRKEFTKEVGGELAAVENDEKLREAVSERLQKRQEANDEQHQRQNPRPRNRENSGSEAPQRNSSRSRDDAGPSSSAPSSRADQAAARSNPPVDDQRSDFSDDDENPPATNPDTAASGRGRGAGRAGGGAKGGAASRTTAAKEAKSKSAKAPKAGQTTLSFQPVGSQAQTGDPQDGSAPKRQRRAAAVSGRESVRKQAQDDVETISDNDSDAAEAPKDASQQSRAARSRGRTAATARKRRRESSEEDGSDDDAGGRTAGWAMGGTRQ